ncbi:MAG: ribonuclease P protein component [Geminicoccaceae bacterium]|nr:ribonuclease P protein component [Geminicoccaceae bacterium]MCB9966523.1 ribonuclease P protein component [Geminicoccaceae bacterium]HRY25084.1 ribonuclease P protein component [Geminicoccaceae bacterium]
MLRRLEKRRDFLRVARGRKAVRPAFVVQMAPAPGPVSGDVDDGDVATEAWRIGFTASRKVGGAVQRNRAKRRLRAVARAVMPELAHRGFDYVLVARTPVLTCPYSRLEADLTAALKELARWARPCSGDVLRGRSI